MNFKPTLIFIVSKNHLKSNDVHKENKITSICTHKAKYKHRICKIKGSINQTVLVLILQ